MVRLLALLVATTLPFAASAKEKPDPKWLKQSADWYAGPEAAAIAANILSFQAESGGWPKNLDTFGRARRADESGDCRATFDNSATTTEVRFLAKVLSQRDDKAIRASFDRGLSYVLSAQYPNGGFPQFHPPGKGYERHITFNDNAMLRLLELLRDVAESPDFNFLPALRRNEARSAFDRGITCILRCQVRTNGKPTAWCAQHDRETLAPTDARAYELASLSGQESVGLTRLLMSLEKPSPEVRAAIEGAVAWFRSTRIDGIRIDRTGGDAQMVADPKAGPLWARFYDLRTGQPFFCDRDGVPKATLAEIGSERRNGYAWYGDAPARLIEKDYPAWKARNR